MWMFEFLPLCTESSSSQNLNEEGADIEDAIKLFLVDIYMDTSFFMFETKEKKRRKKVHTYTIVAFVPQRILN